MKRRLPTSYTPRVKTKVRYGIRHRPFDGATTKTTRVVEFRSGEAVHRHPEIVRYIEEGWTIRSAAPCVENAESVQLIVVLERCAPTDQPGMRRASVRAD